MALGAEVVDLIELHLLDDADQVGAVGQIPVVQHQTRIAFMGILIKMVNSRGVVREAGRRS